MPRALPAVIVIALACLATLCAALPSVVLGQAVSALTEPNVPRTLLGRPYRRRSEATQPCPQARSTVALAGHNGADADPGPDLDPNDVRVSQTKTKMKTGTKMNPKQRVPPPLPLVLNAFPEAGSVRLRLMRSGHPTPGPCTSLRGQTLSREVGERDEEEQQATSRVEPTCHRPQGNARSRQTSVPMRRSKRSWGRKE